MRFLVGTLISLSCLRAVASPEAGQEIRFCPADVARTYPLDSRGRVQSLLAPHIAVINHAAASLTLNEVYLELLRNGVVIDARHLGASDVERFASNSPGIQETLQVASFVFCGTDLIAPDIKLAGPVLGTNEGLVVTNQVFAFDQQRDTLRVRVEGAAQGQSVELTATLPVISDFGATDWLFPLRGVSYVGWGASLHTAHRWVPAEAYALDMPDWVEAA